MSEPILEWLGSAGLRLADAEWDTGVVSLRRGRLHTALSCILMWAAGAALPVRRCQPGLLAPRPWLHLSGPGGATANEVTGGTGSCSDGTLPLPGRRSEVRSCL